MHTHIHVLSWLPTSQCTGSLCHDRTCKSRSADSLSLSSPSTLVWVNLRLCLSDRSPWAGLLGVATSSHAAGRHQGLCTHSTVPRHKGNNGLPKDLDQSHLCQGRASNFQGPSDSNNISGGPQGNNHKVNPSVSNSALVAPDRFRTK